MDLVSVPGVSGSNIAQRITFSYAPVNMQALADGTHVGRDAGHSGHSHALGAHGHSHAGHGGHSHAHGSAHQLLPAHPQVLQPAVAGAAVAAAAAVHGQGQDHTSASASGEFHSKRGLVSGCSGSVG